MKLKKLFALALAGVMALALLTGCSDSSSKTKQVEECFRSLRKTTQNVDYQKDETLDKKLEAIAQQFQPDWLDDRNGGLTGEARNITERHSLYKDGQEERRPPLLPRTGNIRHHQDPAGLTEEPSQALTRQGRVAAPSVCFAVACILLAAAPTAPPCFRRWRRSSPLPPKGEPLAGRSTLS